MFGKKIKNYISEIDSFLIEFDKTHPKSESQLAEIQKHLKISMERDNPIVDKIHQDEFFS